MKTRKLGTLEVSAIGMGCMGFTHAYGETPAESDGINLVHKAFELGCNFFDTAEMYSYFKNEEFVGKALKDLPRDKIVISDKFWPEKFQGHDFAEEKLSETGIRKSLEGSLHRLQTDYIDVYIEHQMDDGSEEQVAFVMGKLIAEGKIRAWGQSSSTLDQIKRAHAVTPISVIQSEYSMMERKWERDVIPFCAANNIGFMAFSPLGNGFLSGKYSSKDEFKGNDVRRVITRFDPKNMDANQPLLDLINRLHSLQRDFGVGGGVLPVDVHFIAHGGEQGVRIDIGRSRRRRHFGSNFLHEPLTVLMIVAMTLILSGIVLVQRSQE